ncbi:ABC transporter ATP-binding protein [Ornithinibacillus salinisoli]|uniref:ABC transporter ATP-binding protein n=1 Tax=Ornithinibacillus salinisoli TaxID=1848459 RepID=A0ABW4W1P4_9BACI
MVNHILLHNISKNFSNQEFTTEVLKNINLTIYGNEYTAIIGPSGSGKSTILSLVGTLDDPTSGQIYFNELDVTSIKKDKLADFRFEQIGFVFQQYHLLPSLTALENVMSPMVPRKVSYDKKGQAEEMLELVGLKDKLNSLPSQLSGGQQQRVAIARALVHKPKWILADEPTGNLDVESSENIFALLKSIHQEYQIGVVFVTHDSEFASRSDRIIELRDGSIVADYRKGDPT